MAAAQARARDTVQSHGVTVAVPSAQELAARRSAMMEHQNQVAKLSNISAEMVATIAADVAAAG
jgi:hypothetical protein